MMTRRRFLQGVGATFLCGLATGSYAFGLEPMKLRVQHYRITPSDWPSGLKLRIAALADIHACKPWMSADRIRYIVGRTNALRPDLVVLLGDLAAGHRFVLAPVHSTEWSDALAGLSAPLGVHAVLGNHDWWDDRTAQRNGHGPIYGRIVLEKVGIRVYENDVLRLHKDGRQFWLAGLGDQLALLPGKPWGRTGWQGVDDLPHTLAGVSDASPVILMVHEPDIFTQVPDRVALTLAGHTHGGQVRVLRYSPVVPSRYGNRYAYGHIVERQVDNAGRRQSGPRSLIVSGGLGCAIMPVRFGVPTEIVVVDIA